jgi:hypothetical protein
VEFQKLIGDRKVKKLIGDLVGCFNEMKCTLFFLIRDALYDAIIRISSTSLNDRLLAASIY